MALTEKVGSHVPPLTAIKQERRSQNNEIEVLQIPEINLIENTTISYISHERERESNISWKFIAGCYKIMSKISYVNTRSPNVHSKISTLIRLVK